MPGHERFVKNMLAGIGGIDLVMLVIAADESIMPQTREHLDICSLLRIRHGLTVLTKIDATDPELVDLAEIEAHGFLKGSFLEGAPVLRVSSQTGEGLAALVCALAELAGRVPSRDASQIFRLPVDRCFTMRGFGTVVAGTLLSGRVARDQDVELLPRRQAARVRGVQVHGAAVDEACAGQRTALNLQKVELSDVQRGMVVVPPGLFTATNALHVHLELLPSAPAPIVRRKRIRFHVGTAELIGYVVLLGQDTLAPGATAFAQVLLEQPTFALPGDRFIIRQYSPMTTIGGGEILDAHPRKHRRSDVTVLERLEMFKDGSFEERLLAHVKEAGGRGAELADLVGRVGVTGDQARETLHDLASRARVRVLAEQPLVVVGADTFDDATAALVAEVARFHADEPLVRGIGREDLKGRALRHASPLLFRGALDDLVARRQLAVDQDLVHLYARRVTLGGEDARIRSLLADRFRDLGLQAPPSDELIAALQVERTTARKIVQLMVQENVLVRISEDTAIAREAVEKLVADVKARKASSSRLGVREFKDLTGLSRKFALPLLEYLDAQRVTRRVGDERVIL